MIRVIDNFCVQSDQVRASAIASGFGTWTPASAKVGSGKYQGMNWMVEHKYMIYALHVALGAIIIPNSMFCRLTNKETERAYVHSDLASGSFTCVAYLSDHKEESGTAFYRHRETGLQEMPLEWMDDPRRGNEMVSGSPKVWEKLDYVRGLYNRAVIFNAPLFHSRWPMQGLESNEDRLVWVCHFDIA